MKLCSVPPVTASLIATTEPILHIAPVSSAWKTDAPSNVVFLSPTLTKQALLLQIALLRPSTMIIGDQAIDADIIEQWRTSHPFGDLSLLRRGTSLDKVRLDLCASSHIRVVNTPGINAPHVAAYIAHWLTLSDGSIPGEVCVLGYGNVGKALVKLLLERDPTVQIKVLARSGQATDCDARVAFVADWPQALEEADAVAICVSLNEESAHRIDRSLIQCLRKHARLVCVSKPDVFSDDALQVMAAADGIQLILDYGPATLEAFRLRTQMLGCSTDAWRRPATLTSQAATTEACNSDLDYAVSVQLSLMALRGLVRRKLAHSLTIPTEPAGADAPRVSVIGSGINGLFQAVMLRLANYQVTVYGVTQSMTAAPTYCEHLFPENQRLSVECNRAGDELCEKLVMDNPSLERAAEAGRIDVSRLEALLERSGVHFLPQCPSPTQIAELSRDHVVVAITQEEDEISIVYRGAYHRIVAGVAHVGDATRGLVWASLIQELTLAN
ncbi:amino acid dehydrogenase [Pseudomonas nabeulensis]|uniref:Amino acid dehydrogenase n=1 Tax=Pseudomonas nabeulensis TaxID=2293833 RepID=A0A4Z0B6Z0_9PSED|nr:NAD(P)-dependent oxidoreductase [Pseudomonas nabeulensis]TFY94480.1 amino acid dehydrogenase [Pseudomonas nabeulensis]